MYGNHEYHVLGVKDSFADLNYTGGGLDIEELLEIDPEAIVYQYGVVTPDAAEERFAMLEDDNVTSQLSAVQTERLYLGGTIDRGPVANPFQLEMLAKQLYPDEFGEFHGIGEIPEEEQLFDRQRLIDIIDGDLE